MADSNAKLRLGLLVDSLTQPRWVYVMLERVLAEGHAEITLVIQNRAPKPALPWYKRLLQARKTLLYSLYSRIEKRLYSVPRDAFTPVDLTPLLASAKQLNVVPEQGKFIERIPAESLDEIRADKLDVLLRLGFRILKGEILNAAACGIWSFHHGDPDLHRGGPAGTWEVLLQRPTTGTILQRLSEELDGGLVLASSQSKTDPLSVRRNTNNIYWKSLSFLPRELARLARLGTERYLQEKTSQQPLVRFYSEPLYTAPTNAQMLRYGWKQFWRFVAHRWSLLTRREQWLLLAKKTTSLSVSWGSFQKLLPPPDRFWADPCLAVHEGKPYLFLEDCDLVTQFGKIAVLQLDEQGRWQRDAQLVLERPYHLSYPFMFQWQGTWYMLPETSHNNTIEVYRCVEFPHRWELAATLMQNVCAVDATLLEHDNRWWLFVNIRENEGASTLDELFLFSAEQPLSTTWVPHPLNPIVSDVRRARPAGPIFRHGEKLIRPSQDSSTRYGRALKFQEITTLTATDYAEREIAAVEPHWDPKLYCTHSYTSGGGWIIGDANRWKSKLFGRHSR